MLSQSNGQTVPQFGCSTGKCSFTEVFFVVVVFVSLVDTGDAKTRLRGGSQLTHWKVAKFSFPKVLRSCAIHAAADKSQEFVVNTLFNR